MGQCRIESYMGLLPDMKNCGLRMRRECRERFPPPPRVGDPDMHHGTCVTRVLWCMPGSLTSGFLWYRWRGKRSRHSRRMRNLQCYVSGKMPMQWISLKNKMLHNRRYLLQTTKPLLMTTGNLRAANNACIVQKEYSIQDSTYTDNICRKCVAWLYSTIITVNMLFLDLLLFVYVFMQQQQKTTKQLRCVDYCNIQNNVYFIPYHF